MLIKICGLNGKSTLTFLQMALCHWPLFILQNLRYHLYISITKFWLKNYLTSVIITLCIFINKQVYIFNWFIWKKRFLPRLTIKMKKTSNCIKNQIVFTFEVSQVRGKRIKCLCPILDSCSHPFNLGTHWCSWNNRGGPPSFIRRSPWLILAQDLEGGPCNILCEYFKVKKNPHSLLIPTTLAFSKKQ